MVYVLVIFVNVVFEQHQEGALGKNTLLDPHVDRPKLFLLVRNFAQLLDRMIAVYRRIIR
jgi:hypothetical protein